MCFALEKTQMYISEITEAFRIPSFPFFHFRFYLKFRVDGVNFRELIKEGQGVRLFGHAYHNKHFWLPLERQ